jgi:hypothetical protein
MPENLRFTTTQSITLFQQFVQNMTYYQMQQLAEIDHLHEEITSHGSKSGGFTF